MSNNGSSKQQRLCSVEGCETKHKALGYCRWHYTKYRVQSGYYRTASQRKRQREYMKTYRKKDSYKRMQREAQKRWASRNPEKIKAKTLVNYAIEIGKLTRQPCEICGEVKSHAHHEDYSKPLDVRWLCSLHHSQQHNG